MSRSYHPAHAIPELAEIVARIEEVTADDARRSALNAA